MSAENHESSALNPESALLLESQILAEETMRRGFPILRRRGLCRTRGVDFLYHFGSGVFDLLHDGVKPVDDRLKRLRVEILKRRLFSFHPLQSDRRIEDLLLPYVLRGS